MEIRESLERERVLETEIDKGLFEMFTFSKGGQEAERLLEKKNFVFQGCELSLRQLLFNSLDKVDLDDLVDSSVLAKITNDEKIVIGGKLSFTNEHNEEYYIRRTFATDSDDIISEEEICNFESEWNKKIIWISNTHASGKTTVLASLAATFKSRFPHLWILHINLSHCTHVFKKLCSTSKSFTIHDFLNKTPNELKTNFQKQLFSVPNKVLLMIDGIDEVSSEYEDLILNLLRYCEKQSNFCKIFVANAIDAHNKIGMEFINKYEVCSLNLVSLYEEEQIDFFKKYWEQSLCLRDDDSKKKCIIYAKKLISEEWIDDENENMGVPLQIRMLAEVLENSGSFDEEVMPKWSGCCDFINSSIGEPLLPKKPNLVELCQLFIHKNIFKNAEAPQKRSLIRSSLQKINQLYGSYLYYLALETTLTKKQRKHFMYKIKSREIPKELKSSGILKIMDGKPRFVHRVFAEYFLAESILNKLQKSTNKMFLIFFVKTILYSDLFRLVRLFLGDFLQNDINSLPHETLKYIGQLLHQNDLVPSWNIELPHDSFAFFGFIFKCFELYGTSPHIFYTSVCNNPVLHYAVERQNLKQVTFFIEKGAPVNSRNIKGQTALFLAARQCNLVMTRYLVKSGADIKCKDENGETALHQAARRGGLKIVEYLVEQKANINSKDRKGYTPLIRAAKCGAMDFVEFLVAKGADINKRSKCGSALFCAYQRGNFDVANFLVTKGADVTVRNDKRETLLHVVCSPEIYKTTACVIEAIKSLIDKGLDINNTNKNLQTALHYAIDQTDRVILIRYLVENGADINCVDRNNDTPLDKAISQGAFEIVRYLMERGVEHDYRNNSLFQACQKGYLNVIQYLAEKEKILNICHDYNKTLLFASVGNIKVTRFLLDQGVEVNYAAPLDRAVRVAHIDTVKLLIERGACDTHETVQLAASRGDLEVVKLLVETNEGICEVNNVGNNLEVLKYLVDKGIPVNKVVLLCNAAMRGNISIIKFLIEYDVDVNEICGVYGRTALNEASRNNHLHTVRFLVKHGANVNLLDKQFCTALQICVDMCYFEIAKFLIENGADIDCDLDESTSILLRVADDDLNMFKYLVEKGARIVVKNSSNILHSVIAKGQCQKLEYILRKFEDIAFHVGNILEVFIKSNYLYMSIYPQKGVGDIIKYLVDGGLQLDIKNLNCQKLFIDATANSDLVLIKFLWKQRVDINEQYNETSALYVSKYLSITKFLVDNGADVNARTKHGRTALHAAAEKMHFDLFRFLIKAGADINVMDEDGLTPVHLGINSGSFNKVKYLLDKAPNLSEADLCNVELHEVISNGDLDTLKLLIDHGAHTGIMHSQIQSTLYKAVQQQKLDMVKLLIEEGAKIHFETKSAYCKRIVHESPSNIFCFAVELCDLDIVRYFVQNGADVNVDDTEGNTALHMAVQKSDACMVKFLLENGAYVNGKNNNDCTPLQSVVEYADLYIAKLLVENGADINVIKDGQTILHSAVSKNHTRLVRYLLELGADANARTRDGHTPLEAAVITPGDPSNVVKLLIKYGADVNATSRSKQTILNLVTDQTHSKVIETLVMSGVDVDKLNSMRRQFLLNELSSNVYSGVRNGKRIGLVKFLVEKGLRIQSERCCFLFQTAAANADLEVVEYLLDQGISPNAKLTPGCTALHSAATSDRGHVINYLIERGADIHSTDGYGRTALHMAAQENCLAAVKVLINLGADVNHTGVNGYTALKIAIVTRNCAVVKYLKKIGAELTV